MSAHLIPTYSVIIETSFQDYPQAHELKAAQILAHYFQTNVYFLRSELHKTPDIKINNQRWEIKSPLGGSKKTIENNLRQARKQSNHIIKVFPLDKSKNNHIIKQN